jgi:hypothetical protein
VTHTQDAHGVADNAVSDDVGIIGHQLAHIRAGDQPRSVRENFKAVTDSEQMGGDFPAARGLNCLM